MKPILPCILAVLLLSSCRESTPNDRALFNLQGNVRELTITKSTEALPHEAIETIHFSEQGFITGDTRFDIERSYGALHADGKWGVKAVHDLQFDDEGRLCRYTSEDSSLPQTLRTEATLTYDDAQRLPRSMRVVTTHGDNPPTVIEDSFIYKTDRMGNWTQRTWNGRKEQRTITYYNYDRGVENCPMSRYLDWRLVILLLISVLIALPMLLHMIRHTFLRKKREPMTAGCFREQRLASGSEPQASASEEEKAREYLAQIAETWSETPGPKNKRLPLTHHQIVRTDRLLRQIRAVRPTDPQTVSEANAVTETLNNMESRVFSGSKLYIFTTLAIALAVSLWTRDSLYLIIAAICSLLYAMGSMRPLFMHLKREIANGSRHRGFISSLFGTIFGTLTPRKARSTMCKWSPETRFVDVSGMERVIFTIVSVVVMILFALLMWLVAVINYLRNYVIYM